MTTTPRRPFPLDGALALLCLWVLALAGCEAGGGALGLAGVLGAVVALAGGAALQRLRRAPAEGDRLGPAFDRAKEARAADEARAEDTERRPARERHALDTARQPEDVANEIARKRGVLR